MDKIIEILDSTLREGSKGVDINLSIEDKLSIIKILDQLGISYIEAGNPALNPNDLEMFKRAKSMELQCSRLVAYGKIRNPNTLVSDDRSCKQLLAAETDIVSLSGRVWDMHIRGIMKITLDENIKMITDTISFFKRHGKMVIFRAEHFFDGFRSNQSYAMQAVKAAFEEGADRVILCDTYGGSFPHDIFEYTGVVADLYPNKVGVSINDDVGCSVANTIVAVRAGATHVQGTYLGFGERCGSTNLSSIIPNLQLKLGFKCIPDYKMRDIYKTATAISDIANTKISNTMPYVGKGAFISKSDAYSDMQKTVISYEHVAPEMVGNKRSILVSEFTPRPAVLEIIGSVNKEFLKNTELVNNIVSQVKEMEENGYQFATATASLELFVLKALGKRANFFEVLSFRVIEEQISYNEEHISSAMVKVKVGDRTEISAAEGSGPVNAMDIAIRKALEVFYPNIQGMKLVDYSVKVIDYSSATTAAVRVIIETSDSDSSWTTIGVSTDVIYASWQALTDSIEYKLIKDKH